MKIISRWTALFILCIGSITASAQDVMIARSLLAFPEAMSSLQNSIIDHKYTLSRVQRVDIGLKKAGFKTDLYRVVFFGKQEELKWISDTHPELSAYLPLKFAIFAEKDETVVVALNPVLYSEIADEKKLNVIYKRWAEDIKSIMSEFRKSE
ncbi:MAG: DUF302 domain-containing protein [Gammaproteobacteria bacterium]|nr:DUF302 domain-containing protein [Gammaproteobacteria bacterium]